MKISNGARGNSIPGAEKMSWIEHNGCLFPPLKKAENEDKKVDFSHFSDLSMDYSSDCLTFKNNSSKSKLFLMSMFIGVKT